MTQKIAELRERIANLQAMGTRSAGNARLVHDEYWRALTRLWVGITEGKVSKHRRKHLSRFLHACSQPLFPQMTEQELEQRLASFIKNFFHSKRLAPRRVNDAGN
jgi:hypothetical protein